MGAIMPPSTVAQRQFNNAVQYVNTATSTQTTGEACKAAVEAYATSLLPPTAMCELVLNVRAPKPSWRTLSDVYTLRKLEYHRTVRQGPLLPVDLHRAGLLSPLEGVGRPRGIGTPSCHGVAQGHRDLMALRLMGQLHALPTGLGAVNQSLLPVDIHRLGVCVAGGNWTQLIISLANFDRLALPYRSLAVEHGKMR